MREEEEYARLTLAKRILLRFARAVRDGKLNEDQIATITSFGSEDLSAAMILGARAIAQQLDEEHPEPAPEFRDPWDII